MERFANLQICFLRECNTQPSLAPEFQFVIYPKEIVVWVTKKNEGPAGWGPREMLR